MLDFAILRVSVCSRCFGVLSGFATLFSLFSILRLQPLAGLNAVTQLIVCAVFAGPASYDWLSHKFRLRYTNNSYRLITGWVEGIGLALLAVSDMDLLIKIVFASTLSLTVVFAGLIGDEVLNCDKRRTVLSDSSYLRS